MALGHHVDTDALIKESQDHDVHRHRLKSNVGASDVAYAGRGMDSTTVIPRYSLPHKGLSAASAYQLLHDELTLDGNQNLNLASFVHTWVPDECRKLMMENLNKNLVDQDEYPASQDVHERCVSMLSGLWHAPHEEKAMGTATTGSSEAIMLGGLALKRRWQEERKKAGKDIHNPGPNIVMGANAQVALEKFARYFEVECRPVPVSVESRYVMDPAEAIKHVDENTIGVFVILGSTYTGGFESVQGMSDKLDEYETNTGHHVPIHVDAASGGFVAPFVYPDLMWDFRLPRVQSINASGHKYGMSLVGVGWIIWRGAAYLPKSMVFELHYLGETDYSFNLNFSRPTHPILGQMFNFLNLGFQGYKRIISADLAKARTLSRALESSGYFTVVSEIHKQTSNSIIAKLAEDDPTHYVEGLPVVAFRFTDEVKTKYPYVQQMWLQNLLRQYSWIVPNYALPPNCEKTEILRVVIRESMSGMMLAKLIQDIVDCAETLLQDGASLAQSWAASDKGQAWYKANGPNPAASTVGPNAAKLATPASGSGTAAAPGTGTGAAAAAGTGTGTGTGTGAPRAKSGNSSRDAARAQKGDALNLPNDSKSKLHQYVC